MLELWFIRHAESLGNLDGTDADTDLSPRGRRQAGALPAALAGQSFDRIISSPLLRARETASIALPGHAVEVEPRLRELVVAGETFLDVSRLGPDQLRALLQAGAHEPPSESGKDFMARVRGWLTELPASGHIVVFTHFGVVRECLGVLGAERSQRIGHASISRVNLTEGEPQILVIDDRRHLDGIF